MDMQVTGPGAAVPFDLPAYDAVQSSGDPTNVQRRRVWHSAEIHAVFSHLGLIWKQNDDLQTELEIMRTFLSKKMKYLNDSVNIMTVMSARVTRSVARYVSNLNFTADNAKTLDPSLVDLSNTSDNSGDSDFNVSLYPESSLQSLHPLG